MENTIIRLASVNDLDEIMAYIEDAKSFMAKQQSGQWQDQHPRRQTIEQDILNHHYYVLLVANKVVAGYALLPYEADYEVLLEGQWITPGPYLVIHRLAVATAYHGHGIAGQLLTHAENIAREQGVLSIRLDTHARNTPMLKLLHKCGYTNVGAVLLANFKRRLAFEKPIK